MSAMIQCPECGRAVVLESDSTESFARRCGWEYVKTSWLLGIPCFTVKRCSLCAAMKPLTLTKDGKLHAVPL